jgi:hypothetical protein
LFLFSYFCVTLHAQKGFKKTKKKKNWVCAHVPGRVLRPLAAMCATARPCKMNTKKSALIRISQKLKRHTHAKTKGKNRRSGKMIDWGGGGDSNFFRYEFVWGGRECASRVGRKKEEWGYGCWWRAPSVLRKRERGEPAKKGDGRRWGRGWSTRAGAGRGSRAPHLSHRQLGKEEKNCRTLSNDAKEGRKKRKK